MVEATSHAVTGGFVAGSLGAQRREVSSLAHRCGLAYVEFCTHVIVVAYIAGTPSPGAQVIGVVGAIVSGAVALVGLASSVTCCGTDM